MPMQPFQPLSQGMLRSPSSEALNRCSDAFARCQHRRLETGSEIAQDAMVQLEVNRFVQAPNGNTKEAASRASRLLSQSFLTPPCHYGLGSCMNAAIDRRMKSIVPEFDTI